MNSCRGPRRLNKTCPTDILTSQILEFLCLQYIKWQLLDLHFHKSKKVAYIP